MRRIPPALFLLAIGALFSSCAQYHARKGEQAMELMAYTKAGKHFEKALAHQQDRALLLLAARTEAKLNHVDEAVQLYAAADRSAPLSGEDALQYGKLLMGLGKYGQAEPYLIQALQEQPENRHVVELIGACQGYRSFYADSARYSVSLVPLAGIAAAYSAIPYGNGLLFTGQREGGMGKNDPWSGLSFTDLYQAELAADGTPSSPQLLRGAVNGPYHEGPAALSPDGRTLYFTRSNYYGRKLMKDKDNRSNLKLFRATLGENGEWGDISEFRYNSDAWSIGHPALSKDGKTLYFTSDMPGGQGGKDLWKSTDIGMGWGNPENLGPTINTRGDEMFPTVVGDALYFSSTGHNNMGGLDIFVTHLEGGFWSEPQNMGYPVNTTRDDLGLWLDSTGTRGYLSSTRTGIDQVHALTIHPPEFALEGAITHAQTGEAVPGATVTLKNMSTLEEHRLVADDLGQFRFDLQGNTPYQVTAEAEGMLAQSTTASTVGLGLSTVLQADLQLEPLVVDKPMAVPNIYYDYDKWDIRPDAAVELNKLAKVFLDNPGITFELSSHTDSRGGDLYNLVLSDARAKSAVDYLVRQGVPPERLIARGYGETVLVNGCSNGVACTEEEHQANRRTEFKVLSKDGDGPASVLP